MSSNRKTTILQELNSYIPRKNKDEVIESRANHLITSAINLLETISQVYDPELSEMLEKRIISSIKNRDVTKFDKTMTKLRESKKWQFQHHL